MKLYWEKEIKMKKKERKTKKEINLLTTISREFKVGDIITLKGEIFWGKTNFISRNFKDFKFKIIKIYKDIIYVKIVSHTKKVLLVTYVDEDSCNKLKKRIEKIEHEKDILKDMKFIFNKNSIE
jgi:hypothetical protein